MISCLFRGKRLLFLIAALIAFFTAAVPAIAQESGKLPPEDEFFVAPLAELNLNSRETAAMGGGAMIGYGSAGTAIGIRILYSTSDELRTLEPGIFLRLYMLGDEDHSGLFFQAEAGPALFDRGGYWVSGDTSAISAGAALGWRFLRDEKYFLEGTLRAGYPFIAGARVCLGLRF